MTTFRTFIEITPKTVETKQGIFGLSTDEFNKISPAFVEKVPIAKMMQTRIKEVMKNGESTTGFTLITEEMAEAIVNFVDGLEFNDVQKAVITYKLLDATVIAARKQIEGILLQNPLEQLKDLFKNLAKTRQKESTVDPTQN